MVDAQSRIDPAYLERSAAVLEKTGAAVVGGLDAAGRHAARWVRRSPRR